ASSGEREITDVHGSDSRCFFFSSRRRHTRSKRDWSSDVCSSDLLCEATVRQATEQHADCLLVHHGMFWGGGGLRPLVGPAYRRIAGLIKGNIALYAAHLPLDRHPDVGNNSVLARMLDIKGRGDFGSYHGAPAGVWGEYHGTRDELSWALTKSLGTAPRLFPFGPERVQRVGIVTGSGGSLFPQAAAAGLDTFITGEGQHW